MGLLFGQMRKFCLGLPLLLVLPALLAALLLLSSSGLPPVLLRSSSGSPPVLLRFSSGSPPVFLRSSSGLAFRLFSVLEKHAPAACGISDIKAKSTCAWTYEAKHAIAAGIKQKESTASQGGRTIGLGFTLPFVCATSPTKVAASCCTHSR